MRLFNLRLRWVCGFLVLLSLSIHTAIGESTDRQLGTNVSFYRDVRPILQAKCHGCHQPAKDQGEYVMTSIDRLLAGGESGLPAIVPGELGESYLVELITPVDGEAEMPRDGDPLSQQQLELIRASIGAGAEDDSPKEHPQYDRDHPPRYAQLPVITSLDFSPDGKLLAVPGYHEVALFSADGAAPMARLIGMSPRIESVRFSPDGKKLAVTAGTAARTGEVQLWDLESLELKLSVPVSIDTVHGASWSPDSKLLGMGCADNSVRAIDVETGQFVFHQGSHNDWVLGTAFSKDGRHLASVSRDMTAKLMDVRTQQLADNITSIADGALKGGIQCVVRHPLRDEILFGGADGVPSIYRMFRIAKRERDGDENLLWRLPRLPGRVFAIDISADGRLIAAGSSRDGSGTVQLYAMPSEPDIPTRIQTILNRPPAARSAREISQLEEHFGRGVQVIGNTEIPTSGVYAVAIHPSGHRVAAAGSDGVVRFIDARDGKIVDQLTPFQVVDKESQVAVADKSTPTPRVGGLLVPLPDETLSEGAEVVGLSVFPKSIHLRRSTDYKQIVVLAELNTGEVLDATRMVQRTTNSKLVAISSTGMVQPVADGSTTLSVSLGGCSRTIPMQVSGSTQALHPDFIHDVSPVISRLGCNTGKCHGARVGKNGFKLSLRGYDPMFDVRALTDDSSARRINLASPTDSLLLLKPTATVPHEGGQLLQPHDTYYEILHAWIANGARLDPRSPQVTRLDVYPINPAVQRQESLQQLRVVATYRDGQRRDVTSEAFLESGNAKVAKEVDGYPGLVEVLQRGEAPILVRYEGAYAATTLTVMGNRSGFVWQPQPSNNRIDDLVWSKLKRTKTLPSPLCDDYEFVRRVYLDLAGLPPTPAQIREFVEAPGDARSKRDALIDRLVGSPEYVTFRTNKWADLLQVNGRFLGREGAKILRRWIENEIANNTPYDEFARKILTASGSNKDNPAAAYYKTLRDPQDLMANTTHLFLATRFTCNECHDHPFERWTQDDFYRMSAWFAQVGFRKDEASGDRRIKTSATEPAYPLYEIVFDKREGEVIHQRTQQIAEPAYPFECEFEVPPDATRREEIAGWITSPNNPYFARSYANRIWGYFLGRGLIEPLDDIRAGNPATNPDLLDHLTREFIESGFDTQHLIRIICKSRVYQLSSATNRWNVDDTLNYSHALPRRLPAEVIYDAIYRTTGAESEFPGVPKGTRAAALPDAGIRLPDNFLSNMGRPARESSCECERNEELQLGVVLALVNCPTVNKAIGHADNAISRLAAEATTDLQLVEGVFLRVLNRPASNEEKNAALEVFQAIDRQHRQLSEELQELERAQAPIQAHRENTRLAELEQVRAELAEHQQQRAPIVAELQRQRRKLIADEEAAVRAYEDHLPTRLQQWEQANQDTTVWTALDPIELIADNERTNLLLDATKSIFVRGSHGPGAYRVLARTDLGGITGIRLDALADQRLDRRGPGRKDGSFVLTELEVERAPAEIDSAQVVAAWEFDDEPGTWTPMSNNELSVDHGRLTVKSTGAYPAMQTPVRASAGSFALEIVAKVNRQAMMRIYWSTRGMTDYDKARSHRHGVIAGDVPWRRYRFHFQTEQDLTGIRLDLDKKNGQMQIESLRLLHRDADFQSVRLVNPQADVSQVAFDIAQAIDGDQTSDNGWAIEPHVGHDHAAVFEVKEVFGADEDNVMRVTLRQNYTGGRHSLGKFRISVTNSPRPLSLGIPAAIAEILAVDSEQRNADQQQRISTYRRAHDIEWKRLQQALAEAQEPLPDDTVLVTYQTKIDRLTRPLPVNREVARLRHELQVSQQQLTNKRLTAAQDLVWALINKPEFLYNH